MSARELDLNELKLFLRERGYRKIYLSHYENEAQARDLAERLPEFEFTIAGDARPLGEDFVAKCIRDSDVLILVSPTTQHEKLIFELTGEKSIVVRF